MHASLVGSGWQRRPGCARLAVARRRSWRAAAHALRWAGRNKPEALSRLDAHGDRQFL